MRGHASDSDASARDAIRAAAEGHGWGVVDNAWLAGAGLSATARVRPGIDGALEGLRRRRARALVLAKRERIAHALRDLAQLMDVVTSQHWALVAVAVDVRTRHGHVALATFAPYERRFLADRTRAALAAKKAAGVQLGRRRAVPQDVVERIVAERQAGASLHTIARGLNAGGISGAQGGRWYASTVRYVLMGASVTNSAGRGSSPAAQQRREGDAGVAP